MGAQEIPFFKKGYKGNFGCRNRAPQESYGGLSGSIAGGDFASGRYA